MPVELYKQGVELKIPKKEEIVRLASDADLKERRRMSVQNFRVVPIYIKGKLINFLASGNPAVFVYDKPSKIKHHCIINGKEEEIIQEPVCLDKMQTYFEIIVKETGCKTLISADQKDDGDKYKFYRERCAAIEAVWE